MRLTIYTLISLLCFGDLSGARARPLRSEGVINPLQIECKLRNDRFWTEIQFSLDANGKVSGVLGNYLFMSNGKKKFISGNILFDIMPFESAIIGHTGDPRGVVSRFSLRHEESNNRNRWIYEQVDPSGEKTVAFFFCFLKTDPRP
jgi:hypothetical protein